MKDKKKQGRPELDTDTKKVPVAIYLKGIEIDALGGKTKVKAEMKAHISGIIARLKLGGEK